MLKSLIAFLTEAETPSGTLQRDAETLDTLDLHTLADLPAYHPRHEEPCRAPEKGPGTGSRCPTGH